MSKRKPVPAEGSEVFPEREGQPSAYVPVLMGGKWVRVRQVTEKPVRDLSLDEYAGGEKPTGDAA